VLAVPPHDLLRLAPDLTAVDRALVEALQADGRRSFAQLARDVEISEKTARRRVTALLESGVIEITAVTDPALLGYGAAALLGVDLVAGTAAEDVAHRLAELEEVDYVVVSAGRYALFVEVFVRDREELMRCMDRRIRADPGVRAVEAFPYLSLYYQQAHFSVARGKGADAPGVRPHALDRTDRRIVRELSLDGRLPFQAIAERIGLSETQVRQRVRGLTASGALQVIAIINPMGLDYRTMAWVAIRVAPGARISTLAETVARLPFVTYVAICTGRADIFAEVICVDEAELLRLLDSEIRAVPGIADLEVSIYLELLYKRLWPAPAPAEDEHPASVADVAEGAA
jgi:Lrp/AsnC family transcriptional regulator for asnA, asnC and gidA